MSTRRRQTRRTRSRAGLRLFARVAIACCAALLALAGRVPALDPPGGESPEDESALLDELFDQGGGLPPGFGDDLEAYLIWDTLDSGRHVEARERAQALLRRQPRSIGAHVVMALALRTGEGNLGRARYFLSRALEMYEDDYGLPPSEESPWRWHLVAQTVLAELEGDMGDDAQSLRILDERDGWYGLQPADRGWALMRLGHYDRARAAAEAGLMLDTPRQHSKARNTLCALEAEQLHREASLERCLEALDHHGREAGADPLFFANAAEAALGMLQLDTAERLYLDATERFVIGTPANPWLDLTHLFLAQGRTGESLGAMRSMFDWRARQPAIVDAQTRTAVDLASATLLLVAGKPLESASLSARAVDRPDRLGRISFAAHARRGAASILYRVASLTAAEWQRERASWLPFREAWLARLDALGWDLRAWWSGRHARSLIADERLLVHTVVPYAPGSVVLPEWLQPEIVAVAGPGPIDASVRRALARDARADESGYLNAMRAEVANQNGDDRAALDFGRRALDALPRAEVLLRGRVAARAAGSALEVGDRSAALELFDQALQADPGSLRRLGIALPVAFASDERPLSQEVHDLLRDSPRFDDAGFGFRVQTRTGPGDSVESCLIGPSGALYACAEATPEPGEDQTDQARRVAALFHERAFAPSVDLTQRDLDSLDGSTAELSIRGTDRARSLLSEWGAEEGETATPD